MTLVPRTLAGIQAAIDVEYANPAGAQTPVNIVQVRDAEGVAKTIWQRFSVSLSSLSPIGYGNNSAVTTSNVTATPNGGTPPYSITWSRTDGGPVSWTILSPNSLTTAFRCNSVGLGDAETANFRCSISDSNGSVALSSILTASAVNTNGA